MPTLNTGYFCYDQGRVILVVVLDGFAGKILHDLRDWFFFGDYFTNGSLPKSIHDPVGANHNALGVLQGKRASLGEWFMAASAKNIT